MGGRARFAGGALFLLALVIRLAALAGAGSWHVPEADDHFAFSYENGRIARSLVQGEGFASPYGTGKPSAWMPPVYPFVLAASFAAFGVYHDRAALAVLVFQCVLGALAVVALRALALRVLGSPRGALAAAVALMLYPAAVYFSAGMVWPSELAVLLLLLVLLEAERYRSTGDVRRALVAGGLTGLLALVDTPCLVVGASLLLAMALASAVPLRTRAMHGALAVLAALVLPLAWTARNVAVFGEWVFIKSNFGHELWLGNNPHATGFWLAADGSYMADHLPPGEYDRIEALSEPDKNRAYATMAKAWMRDHPDRVLALSLRRAGWFWWRTDFPSVREKGERAGAGRLAQLSLTVSLRAAVVLGALGAAVALARRRPIAPLLLFLALYPAGYYLAHMSSYRYRHPVEPILLLLAGALVGTAPREERTA